MSVKKFSEWLEEELKKRNWRQADLARVSGVDSGLISRILNYERQAGSDTCVAIARALKIPPVEVFRRAGLLPGDVEPGDTGEFIMQIRSLVESLSSAEREELLELMYWYYNQTRDHRDRYRVDSNSTNPNTA